MNKRRNIWKLVSIALICLFAIVLALGLYREFHFRSSVVQATDAQIQQAKDIALNDLSRRGEDLAGFTFRISNRIRPLEQGKSIMDVTASNDTVRHTYLIDLNSQTILVYSRTEFNSAVPKLPESRKSRPFFAP